MNRKKLLLPLASALLLAAGLSSCRNGEKNPPIMTLSDTELTVLPWDTLDVTVNYDRGDRQIKKFKVWGFNDETKLEDDFEDENTYVYDEVVPGRYAGTTQVIVFSASDTRGNETSADLTLNILTPLYVEKNGIVTNAQGTNATAWDLVENEGRDRFDSNTRKDIIDQTSGATGNFSAGGWTSGNDTRFVIDSTFDYDRATVTELADAYAAGEETNFLSPDDLKEGSVILAKLRGEDSLMTVIRIIEVYDDGANGGTGNNSDYRKFTYKK